MNFVSEKESRVNADSIIKRLKKLLCVNTDQELADILGVNRATVAQWRRRNAIGNWELIFNELPWLDYNYLIFGDEYPILKKRFQAKNKIKSLTKCKSLEETPLNTGFMRKSIQLLKEEKLQYNSYKEQLIHIIDKLSLIDQYRLFKIAKVLLEIEEETK